MSDEKLTTATLRKTLFECIDDVRRGVMDPKAAKEVGSLARTMVDSARLEIEHSQVLDNLQKPAEFAPKPMNLGDVGSPVMLGYDDEKPADAIHSGVLWKTVRVTHRHDEADTVVFENPGEFASCYSMAPQQAEVLLGTMYATFRADGEPVPWGARKVTFKV